MNTYDVYRETDGVKTRIAENIGLEKAVEILEASIAKDRESGADASHEITRRQEHEQSGKHGQPADGGA